MPQDYAQIRSSIWNDPDFVNLGAGPQRLYVVILSQPEMSLCGIQQPAFKRWARFAPDTTTEDVELDVKTLIDHNFVVIDIDTEELLVRSFVRHGVNLKSPLTVIGLSRAYETIRSKPLRKVVMEELRKVDDHNLAHRLTRNVPDGEEKPLRQRLAKGFVIDWDVSL
jgi:hypothetical protein